MDAQTFQNEVLKIERLLYHVSFSLLRNNADCADAVQEALMRAWQKRDSLHDIAKFKPWLIRILTNQCHDMLRRQQKRSFLPLDESDVTLSPPPLPSPLHEAIGRLKPEWRLVITLHHLEDYSIKEVAQLLQLPTGTVKTRLKAARKHLGATLYEDWKEGLM